MKSILELEEGEREQQRRESSQRRRAHRVSRSHLEAVGVRTSLRGLHQRDLIEHSANSHVHVSVAGGHSRAQSIGEGATKSAHEVHTQNNDNGIKISPLHQDP